MTTLAEVKKNKTTSKTDGGESKGRADHIDHLVSKRLKMRRMILGLSQQELGEAVAVSIQQVQKYEKATNRISSGKLYSFAKFLKVPVSYFFNHIEDSSLGLGSVFAEEAEEYNGNKSKSLKNSKNIEVTDVSEREIISLIKAFGEVKNVTLRKKIIELIKIIE
jgi:transcriptional regulator with XRE-family HTH domain